MAPPVSTPRNPAASPVYLPRDSAPTPVNSRQDPTVPPVTLSRDLMAPPMCPPRGSGGASSISCLCSCDAGCYSSSRSTYKSCGGYFFRLINLCPLCAEVLNANTVAAGLVRSINPLHGLPFCFSLQARPAGAPLAYRLYSHRLCHFYCQRQRHPLTQDPSQTFCRKQSLVGAEVKEEQLLPPGTPKQPALCRRRTVYPIALLLYESTSGSAKVSVHPRRQSSSLAWSKYPIGPSPPQLSRTRLRAEWSHQRLQQSSPETPSCKQSFRPGYEIYGISQRNPNPIPLCNLYELHLSLLLSVPSQNSPYVHSCQHQAFSAPRSSQSRVRCSRLLRRPQCLRTKYSSRALE